MNNTKPHIVFLTPGFAVSEEDSTTIPALQIYLKAFVKEKPEIKVTLISFQFPFTNKAYNWNGINIIPLNGRNSKLKRLFIWRNATAVLNEIHSKKPITTIHSFWIGECSFIGEKFAVKNKLKHVITAMGQDVIKNKYIWFLKSQKSKIITLSENQNAVLATNYNLKSQIIPWFIDEKSFPDVENKKIDILGVGSLNRIKNYPSFIEVIRELVKIIPEIRVEIIGEGTEYFKIKKLIENYQLQNTIKLVGQLPRMEVLQKMSQSKILLHTSKYESFGFVFPEALYSGMNIISYNVGSAKKSKKWLVCKNHNEMTLACKDLLTDYNDDKKRLLIYPEKKTISAYLKLYYE